MMSQQQQQQQGNQKQQQQLYQQLTSHSVASTLAQIGVDPGYYSDSECSSNSSDKVNEEGNSSPPQNKLTRIPEQQIQQQPNSNYNCFNDYFGFNELVRPLPLRYPDALVLGSQPSQGNQTPTLDSPSCGGWNTVESPAKDSAVSEGGESVEDNQLYTPATSPPSSTPPTLPKKGSGKRKVQVCVFCRNNGEDESVYSTHALKSPDGKVTCPILFAYECPICRATGENAHTLKYCPRNPNGQGHVPGGSGAGQYQQGYSGSSNMGYGNSSAPRPASQSSQFNSSNLMQAMLHMAQMNGGNMHPALAQLNFNMAAMLYQQQLQNQGDQPNNPFAEWVQQQQQFGGEQQQPQQQQQQQQQNKNYTQQQSSYSTQSSYSGSYSNPSPGYNSNYNPSPSYSSQGSYNYNNYPEVYHQDPYSSSSSPSEVDNLSQLFGKASIDDFLQNYSR